MKTIVRQPFNYDADAVSEATGLKCPEPTLTVQGDKDDADINVLVKRFGLTGEVPVLDRIPIQADFIPTMDYKTALEALQAADDTFMTLPAEMRQRFNHDPGQFLDFTSKEENRDEMIKMGLIEPPIIPIEAAPPPKPTEKPVS